MRRKLQMEFLEERQLLAVGPRLIAIEPNVGDPIELNDVLHQAPDELKLVFDSGDVLDATTLASGILMFRSDGDGVFDDGNDIRVTPAFMGLGTAPNEVFLRFSQTLPDDHYRIQIVGAGSGALRDVDGDAFGDTTDDGVDNGVSTTIEFELQLGAQVISVVPQPVRRDPSTGALTQAKEQIEVYFNEADLDPASASTPAFYRLIDTRDQSLLFPSSVLYDAAEGKATLTFPSDLSTSTYQLQIGATEELNDSIIDATDLGTISQQSVEAIYDSPVIRDINGNEVPVTIPDGGSVISAISVIDSFFISDVNVELDVDHEWGPDLRIYLRSPGGQRVELVRDLGSQVRGGQIYGVKYDDLNGDGQRDANEPGLPGWTIFIDTNNNGDLDPGERSTVTDSEGRYSFVNLDLNQSYKLVEIPQLFWQSTAPIGGAAFELYSTDFSDGSQQTLTITGNTTAGTFRLGFLGRATAPIQFAGLAGAATTATNIEQAVAGVLDPGVAISVTAVDAKQFVLNFSLNGIGTAVEHPAISVVDNQLNVGTIAISNAADSSGYTSSGTGNQWHISSGRGNQFGHSPQWSFYFGQGESANGGGSYDINVNGTLTSPVIDLSDPLISGPITLHLNHFLSTEAGFDTAVIRVVSGDQTAVLLNTTTSTVGFEALALDLSAFAGRIIQLEFEFDSDFIVTEEGWYVDDIRIEMQRASQTVTLVDAPQQRTFKNADFGATKTPVIGPDQFGYQAYRVATNFEDISANSTARKILRQFTATGQAIQIGGTGDDSVNGMAIDSSGNVYLAGSFQGTVDFDLSAGVDQRTSVGGNDAFVAKYDSSGNLLWVRTGGGTSSDVLTSVVVDDADNVIVGGSYSTSANFGGVGLTSNGSTDALIWKLDSAGNTLWARGFGGTAIDEARDVDVDASGQIAATGFFSGTTDFDPGTGPQNLTSAGSTDIFVLRLTAAGNFIWVRQLGGTGADRGEGIHITSAGNVTTTGSFSGTVDFNPGGGTSNLTSAGSSDGFTQQMTATGNFRWASRFGGTGSDRGNDVTSDASNGVYVTGVNNNEIYIQRFSANGASQWVRNIGGSSTDVGESIFVEANGTVSVAGSFRSTVNFGSGAIASAGGSDAFVLQLNGQGNFQGVQTYGGTLDDGATGVIVESAASLLVAGNFRGTASFDVGTDGAGGTVVTLTSNGGNDGFLARIARPEGVDDAAEAIAATDLNGFEFNFYGNLYDGLFVSSNGLVTFTNSNDSSANSDLLITPNEPTIAAFWEDLRTGAAEVEGVFWDLLGAPGDRRLIVQWSNVRVDNAAANLIGPLDFQAVLNERDGSIELNYRTVAEPQAVQDGTDRPVGTFGKGVQQFSRVAAAANGDYVVVWNSSNQDDTGPGNGVYGRLFTAAGVAKGNEFQINQTTIGEQTSPSLAINANGRFVVAWYGNGPGDADGVFARIFAADGTAITDEFLVHRDPAGPQQFPAVGIDGSGNFVVAWQGQGSEDVNGITLRRFAANGQPLGLVDEIQRVRFLGPPTNGSLFTMFFNGIETATIVFSNNANQLATRIRDALRALPNTGDQINVIALPTANELQTLNFVGGATTGTVQLRLGLNVTADITYAGVGAGATTATNIQTALEALPNIGAGNVTVTQVGASDNDFTVAFVGALAGTDVELLELELNALDMGTLQITGTTDGTTNGQDFNVLFLGPDGGVDQPLLGLGNTQGGVTHTEHYALREGSDGELRVNNVIVNAQTQAAIDAASGGEFIVSWSSSGQDGSLNGVFSKRFDASGVAIDPEFDELQRITLQGPLGANAQFTLRIGNSTTGLINYAGANRGSTTATNIQTAINALPGMADVVVTADQGTSNEIQQINFTNGPNVTPGGGTFRLAHRGLITAPITYAGPLPANAAATATNIQDALRLLTNTGNTLTVVPVAGAASPFQFIVTFLGTDGGIDHPPLVPTDNQLNQGSLSVNTIDEGGLSSTEFLVSFEGTAGRRDQPDIQLINNTLGVTSIIVEELIEGHNSEFQVNVETTGQQQRSQTVLRADGSFFTVWQSAGQDGDGDGIFGKLFDANGDVLRDEFQINTFTQGAQSLAQAGVDALGNLVVVWSSAAQDGDGIGIYARRFGSDGFAIGDEILVNTMTGGDQVQPSVAVNGDGTFVVTFGSEAGFGGIHSQRFAANGTKVGPEDQVSQFGVRNQATPEIARSANGNYVVVWTDVVRDNDVSSGIYAQVFDVNNNAISGEIQVNQVFARDQLNPAVAIDDAGNFVVIWKSLELDTNNNTVATIRGRQFSAAGAAVSAEFQISNGQVFAESLPDVHLDQVSGRWVAVWTDLAGPNVLLGDVAVRGKVFNAAGVAQTGEIDIMTSTSANGIFVVAPRVAIAPSGEFSVVAIGAFLDGFSVSSKVFARVFNSNGSPKADSFLIEGGQVDDPYDGNSPDIAVDSNGNYRATWLSSNLNVALGSYDANGTIISNGVEISDPTAGIGAPRIDIAPDDSFQVTWDDGASIYVQRFAASGTAIGPNLITSDHNTPSVASSNGGYFAIVNLDSNGVFVQSFSTDLASVGIKDAGVQSVGGNVLQIWVDGSSTQLVGPDTSTRIAVINVKGERLFAVDGTNNRIVELDAVTGGTLNTFPAPRPAGADAGLAFAGGTLYYIASNGNELFELDPDNGAIVDSMVVSGVAVDGLAVLNGQVVLLDSTSGELVFIDSFEDEEVRRLTPAVAIVNGLAGGGDRGTLFGLDSQSRIVEINGDDGSLVAIHDSPGAALVGLAFVQGVILATNKTGTVYRVQPMSGDVLGTLAVPAGLSALGADGGGGILQAVGGDYQPLLNTVLDDEAALSILEGVGPYTGNFRPVEPLSTFDATNALGSWRLEIDDTATGNTGVLNRWQLRFNTPSDTPPDASHVGFIGDNLTAAVGRANDVDLYRFELLSGGTIRLDAIPDPGLNIAIRLFDSQGNPLRSVNAAGTDGAEQLIHAVANGGTYYVGLSSASNLGYAANGSGASGGTTTGSYKLEVRFSEPLSVDDNNSSFDDATLIGPLGIGGTQIRAEIRNEPLTFRMPGPIDEPGHRDVPVEEHLLGGGASAAHKGQIILSFNDGVSASRRAQILDQHNLQLVKQFDFIGASVVATKPGTDVASKVLQLSQLGEIRYAEPDFVRQVTATPNDSFYPDQWHYNNVGQTGGTVDADIDLPEAWDTFTGSAQTVIAIIDSGVDLTHPDLVANLWVNPGEIAGDGIDNDGNGYIDDIHGIDPFDGDSVPQDQLGHGTHVAGTTAAVGDNGLGVSGINWNAKIMALRVGDSFLSDSAIIESLNYIVTMKTVYGINVVVSNNSYGGGGFSQAEFDAIQASISAGIGYVAAAGNDGLDNDAIPHYPASYDIPQIISVAATDDDDLLAGFSNYGLTSVDIAAPGVNVLSTTLGGGYGLNNGTSMASPHVAGVYALLAGANPSASVAGIRSAIMLGADPLPNLTGTSVSGARLNAAQSLAVFGAGGSGPLGTATKIAFYNFQDVIGVLPSGAPALNAITENQIARAREIFEIYSNLAGIQFIETDNEGMTIATGDMRALDPTVQGGPGGVAGLAGGGLGGTAIMDAGENWGDSEYGAGWFQVAMHEIGHLLGLGHAYDLPNLTIMGGFGVGEPVFPGDHDIIHARFVHPQATKDQDLYEFSLNEPGTLTAETIAERILPNSSTLDTSISLYQEVDGKRVLIANNDDYYSNDSFLQLRLEAGTYFISVFASHNAEMDPAIADTGFGGTSYGDYELKLDFAPDAATTIVDLDGVALDGDANGTPGGLFNFYFETGHTIFVDKLADVTPGVDGDGSIGSPLDNIRAATEQARSTLVMPVGGGADVIDGEFIVISDGVRADVRFEFDDNDVVSPGSYAIPYTAASSRDELAAAVAAAIDEAVAVTPSILDVTTTVSGVTVRIDGTSKIDSTGSPALIATASIVRIIGNGGTDGDTTTLADNRPYLLGLDGVTVLADGVNLEVPQGVTVMVDAGALFKLSKANLDVGSSAEGIFRNAGALQILGTPSDQVSFYSYRNDAVGGDSNGPGPGPTAGDWGGLVFRADSDMEERDIFLNWVNNATIVSGGGKLLVESVETTFTPVHLEGARPTISNNTIQRSADAAISADPASFEDTGNRIGPDIQGNTIIENSLNGLFIRIRTELGEILDRITLPSRMDDTDIPHILTENLLIEATPGGPRRDAATGIIRARLDGSLKIDPGIILKIEGARIEVLIGGQLIAEGDDSKDVIFTALNDDSYGGSGSFDTKNDGDTLTLPGQWGGLFFNAMSEGSIDHALIAYGGGLTPIEGGFDRFNAIEVHQADVRLTNSVVRNNASGQSSSNRSGRGGNAAATIFVRGEQPVIFNNVIENNLGTVIHINANAMQAVRNPDPGRQTGMIDRNSAFDSNLGPLVRDNRLLNNSVNGMEVRAGVLTTEAAWDDVDIVHVLRGEIQVLNHHTFSGLHLISSASESLVVKMSGPDAGFTANGTLLDIDDRIGGSLYIGGSGAPVILTSLADDTAAAGVDFFGRPLGDTDNNGPTTGAPGDWRSVRLDRYSNDRNVALIRELEPAIGGTSDLNGVPADARFLGNLAPDEKSGDVNRRLGFEIHGTISYTDASDLDLYSFTGVTGTEVFFDLDKTNAGLDTIVEVVDATGTVVARSVDNLITNLSGAALPLLKATHLGDDYFTISERDAGMRVILPGVPGETNTYFVRVRSTPTQNAIEDVRGGLSRGDYKLQIRLQQRDERPGSFVDGADIRFATNGIEVIGMPGHSPLLGESVETRAGNETLAAAQPLGNLLEQDRNTISVGGNLTAPNDLDWYSFQLDYQFIQSIAGRNNGDKTWATIFDIDYADGIARADTVISVFDDAGNLVLVSRDSHVDDDQPGVGQGADTDDLSRGTFGTLDPFIGSVQMPAGATRTYYVAVSSNSQLPTALNGNFTTGASNTLVRLEPVNSLERIAEDHIGFEGYISGSLGAATTILPRSTIFDISSDISLSTNVVPFTLNDVVLYTARAGQNGLQTANAYTGEIWTNVGNLPTNNPARTVTDIVMRSDGRLYMYESLFGMPGQNTAGRLVELNPGTGAATVIGNDSIPDFNPGTNPPDIQQLTSDAVQAFAWQRTGVDDPRYNLWYAVEGARRGPGIDTNSSTLYRANDATGSAAVAQNQPWGRRGEIFANTPGDLGVTTGMAYANGTLYGVSNQGFFYSISTATGQASNPVNLGFNFSGLTEGPQNLEGGRFSDILFGVTTTGEIVAIDTAGNLQAEFQFGTSSNMGVNSVGIAFSPLDFNLWHPTMQRRADAGHGINDTFDESRTANTVFNLSINGRQSNDSEGGASFYFGFEPWVQNPDNSDTYFDYGVNAQYGILNTATHQDLSQNPLLGDNFDMPGGAFGSLQTLPIDLSQYQEADKPTIYFNYYLETENLNTITGNEMNDTARVLVSADGGNSWDLLATNNSVLSTAGQFGELPRFISPSVRASTHPRQQVQELFDNSGGWRQARIDLANYAGEGNLQFRFDFSTAAAFPDQPGDPSVNGNLNDADRGLANSFEGFYVDDVIIGFAERGEMVTASPAQSTFFQIPQNPDPADPAEILVGNYQLEVRRGTEYAESINDLNPDIIHYQTFDTNDRLIQEVFRLGDANLPRDQGQILIANNTINDTLEFGVLVDSGLRDGGGSLTRPGGVRALPTLNNERLVPGVKVENNVISNFGTGGILFSGDPNAGTLPLASVPFGRIMNNTIYGNETARGVAIQVSENASPTILNNIIANTATGLTIDGTSGSTVVGANLFSGNLANGVIGQNAILLQPTDPLFVNPANKNFYLAAGTLAVDSSLNVLADRINFVAVNSPLGIPPSPIIAPERDRFRQLRVDDPSQDPPPGLGSNIFKDRGAVERADFVRPFVQLVNPEDNDAAGADLNPIVTEVLVDDDQLDEIRIRVVDVGVGIDETSIVSSAVTVTFDGTLLTEGVDYDFVYFSNGRAISLQNLPDNPEGQSRYDITFDNAATGIVDLAGNLLSNNRPDGTTAFTVISGVAPGGINDNVMVDEDSFVLIDVLDNDLDVGSPFDPATLIITRDPLNGIADVVNGEIRYQPFPDYFGPDSLTYRFSDLEGRLSNTTTVFITVNPINDEPIAMDDPDSGQYLFLEDDPQSPVAISWDLLLANDSAGPPNESGQVLSVVNVAALNSDPSSEVSLIVTNDPANRVVLVTPQADENGIAKFTYFVQDDQVDFSTSLTPATVTLEFLSVNDAPLTDPNLHAARGYNVDEDPQELTPPTSLLINASDIVSDDLPGPATAIDELASQTVQFVDVIAASENGGTVTYDPSSGMIEYIPSKDFFGTDFVYYVIEDALSAGGVAQSWTRLPDGTFVLVDDPQTSVGTIAVTVNPRNDPPIFERSDLEGLEDNAARYSDLITLFGITGGPGEPDPVSIGLSQQAGNGTVDVDFDTITGLYGLIYQPNPDFFGTDTFVLTLTDAPVVGSTPESVEMTVTMTVRPANDAPLGVDDSINLIEGQVRTIPVSLLLGNDQVDNVVAGGTSELSSAAGNRPQRLTLQSIAFAPGSPAGGSVQLSQDRLSVTIVPPANYYSTDGSGNSVAPDLQFIYTFSDDGISYLPPASNQASPPQSDPLIGTATVTATVYPTNNAPIARTHKVLGSAIEDMQYTIPVDLLIPTDALVDSLPIGGAIPAEYDSAGAGEDLGPNGVKDAGETLTQRLSVLSPVSGLSRISTTFGGTVEFLVNPSTGKVDQLLYTPPINFASVPTTLLDSFNYRVADDGRSFQLDSSGNAVEIANSQKTAVGRVEIELLPRNDRPQFNTASLIVNTLEDSGPNVVNQFAFNITAAPISALDETNPVTGQSVAFTVTPLSFTPQESSQYFTQLPVISPTGNLSFRPADDAFGQFLFEVVLIDNGLDDESNGDFAKSIPVTMTLNVGAVNDPPSFVAGGPVAINEDIGPYTQSWATNISVGPANESAQTIEFEVVTPAEFQDLFLAGRAPSISADGILRFTTAQHANGVASVEVTAVDSEGGRSETVTLQITVNEVNDPPVAVADSINTNEDLILQIPASQLLANDRDPDLNTNPNEVLTIVMPLQSFSVSGASVTYDPASGVITYDPTRAAALQALPPGEMLVDSFPYSVRDAAGVQSNVVTVALNVAGINDAPRVEQDNPLLEPSGPTVISVLSNDVDVDGFIIPSTVRIELPPAFGSAEARLDGTIVYTPFTSASQEDVFTYSVADNLGLRSQAAFVTISANASPIALNDAKVTYLDEPISINVAGNDSDPDGTLDLASIEITTRPLRGQAIEQSDGTVQYVPSPGFVGRDSFRYRIFDNGGRPSNIATVNVEVVASRLQNPDINTDVNDDGETTALDALLVINHMARSDGATSIPVLPTDRGPNFYDVNGNQIITSGDALVVINELSRINNGSSSVGRELVLATIDDEPLSVQLASPQLATSQLASSTLAPEAEDLAGSAKIVGDTFARDASDDLIDLIAESRDDQREEGIIDALDAAFADLL